jgi:hypothetical protein
MFQAIKRAFGLAGEGERPHVQVFDSKRVFFVSALSVGVNQGDRFLRIALVE